MYCNNCGAGLKEGDKFCGNCGCSISEMPETGDINDDEQEIVEKNKPIWSYIWRRREKDVLTPRQATIVALVEVLLATAVFAFLLWLGRQFGRTSTIAGVMRWFAVILAAGGALYILWRNRGFWKKSLIWNDIGKTIEQSNEDILKEGRDKFRIVNIFLGHMGFSIALTLLFPVLSIKAFIAEMPIAGMLCLYIFIQFCGYFFRICHYQPIYEKERKALIDQLTAKEHKKKQQEWEQKKLWKHIQPMEVNDVVSGTVTGYEGDNIIFNLSTGYTGRLSISEVFGTEGFTKSKARMNYKEGYSYLLVVGTCDYSTGIARVHNSRALTGYERNLLFEAKAHHKLFEAEVKAIQGNGVAAVVYLDGINIGIRKQDSGLPPGESVETLLGKTVRFYISWVSKEGEVNDIRASIALHPDPAEPVYHSLYSRSRGFTKEEREAENREKGEKGEADVEYRLKWWIKEEHQDYELVRHDCISKYGSNCIKLVNRQFSSEAQEFDHILVGPGIVIHIETKAYDGKITVIDNDLWERLSNGFSMSIRDESPCDQVRRHDTLLRSIVGKHTEVRALICIADPTIEIVGAERSEFDIIPISKLQGYLTDLIAEHDPQGGPNQREIMDVINSHKIGNERYT